MGPRHSSAASPQEQLAASPMVDAANIAAMGYCFGGRAVLDLLRTDPEGLRGVASFHGILDDNPLPPSVTSLRARALICHADNDPFVSPEDLAALLGQLRAAGCRWELQMFGGSVLHGFTNPAQALNDKPQFDYDEHSATAAWAAARVFLGDVLT